MQRHILVIACILTAAAISAPTRVALGQADIGVELTGPAASRVGEDLVYLLRVYNSGPGSATDVVVAFSWEPSNLFGDVIVSGLPEGVGSCTTAGEYIFCDPLPSLAHSSETYYQLEGKAGAEGTLSVLGVAEASAQDNDESDNMMVVATTLGPPFGPDLHISIDDAADPVVVGNELEYAIQISNLSPSLASTPVTVHLQLDEPDLGQIVEVVFGAGAGSCSSQSPASTICLFSPLEPGGALDIGLRASSVDEGVQALMGEVSSSQADRDESNNSTIETTTIIAAFGAGEACAHAGECASGFCVDGVCCDSTCTEQCEACDILGNVGTCTPVIGAPRGGRTPCASDGSACGGACNGVSTAACVYPAGETMCRDASCTEGIAILADVCDGAGACPSERSQPCAPYACGAQDCLDACVDDADCRSGVGCRAGACEPRETEIVADVPSDDAGGFNDADAEATGCSCSVAGLARPGGRSSHLLLLALGVLAATRRSRGAPAGPASAAPRQR